MNRPGKQSGVALITVLLALSLMVSLAAVIAENVFTQFQRATQRENYQQAYWYAIGVEALAKVALKESFNDSDTTNLSQPWAVEERHYPLDYGDVVGQIFDQQACFNLNVLASDSLTASGSERPFLVEVLLHTLELQQVDSYQAEMIADSLYEYLDRDNQVDTALGLEDSYYESMTPAYLPPNGLIADESELRAVQQVSGDVMQKMHGLWCALPEADWRLNVNTLSLQQAPLLAALFDPYLSLDDARSLLESRPYEGWADLDSFVAEPQIEAIDNQIVTQVKGYLDVVSDYYELDALVTVDASSVRLRTLFYSSDRENIKVVRRRFGGMRERIPDHPDQ